MKERFTHVHERFTHVQERFTHVQERGMLYGARTRTPITHLTVKESEGCKGCKGGRGRPEASLWLLPMLGAWSWQGPGRERQGRGTETRTERDKVRERQGQRETDALVAMPSSTLCTYFVCVHACLSLSLCRVWVRSHL
jgi:hypothetical protein